MAQPYVTGSCLLFAGPAGGGAGAAGSLYSFLGTCENTPNIRLMPDFEPVMNDLGGQRKSFDRTYQGTDAMVSGVLTRWNETIYQRLANLPSSVVNAGGAAAGPGIDLAGSIGTLMILEGVAFPLVVEFPYGAAGRFAKAAFAQALGVANSGGPLPNGYTFFAAQLESHDRPKLGTGYSQLSLSFFCGRVFNPTTGAFSCFTPGVPAGLPPIT